MNIGHGRPDSFVLCLDLLSFSRDRRLSESHSGTVETGLCVELESETTFNVPVVVMLVLVVLSFVVCAIEQIMRRQAEIDAAVGCITNSITAEVFRPRSCDHTATILRRRRNGRPRVVVIARLVVVIARLF